MTDFNCEQEIQKLTKIVEELQAQIDELTSERAVEAFERIPLDATVGKSYVAWRFGCTESAVTRGRFHTNLIPRAARKPLKFIRRDVDKVWKEIKRPVSEIVAELLVAGAYKKPKRRKELIRRK